MNIKYFIAHDGAGEKNSRKKFTSNIPDCPRKGILKKDDHIIIICCCCIGLTGNRYDKLRAICIDVWDDPLTKSKWDYRQ